MNKWSNNDSMNNLDELLSTTLNEYHKRINAQIFKLALAQEIQNIVSGAVPLIKVILYYATIVWYIVSESINGSE